MNTPLIERIRKEIEDLDIASVPEEIGTIISVGDGIAEINGLKNAQMMEMVLFDTEEKQVIAAAYISPDERKDFNSWTINYIATSRKRRNRILIRITHDFASTIARHGESKASSLS